MTGRRIRLGAAAVALAVLATAPALAAAPDSQFSDVDAGRFYTEPIAWARQHGVVEGYSDHCFLPSATATRAESVAVIHRALGEPDAVAEHAFTDLTGEWQSAPVAWAVGAEVTTGTSPTTFHPNRTATRAEVAAFLWRAAGRPHGPASPFADVTREWQIPAIDWLAHEGITTGRAPTIFDPDAPVTRAELVTFVWRWLDEPEGPDLPSGPVRNCTVDTGRCAVVFDDASVAVWRDTFPGARFTAAVHDHRTGCAYHLEPDLQLTTASVIKAQVLAAVLLQAQDEGRDVTDADADRIELMIHYSHNRPPTSELYVAVGSAAGMEATDGRFGIVGTSHTPLYGATLSTAEDRTRLVEQLLIGGGPLDADSVEQAWEWMSTVSEAQTWGVSAGLPAAHDYALKNGFYPMSGRGWRLGTTGAVIDPGGGTYALTVMTDLNPNETAGIALVESIAAHINSRLTAGPAAPRPVDDVTCMQTTAGTSWSTAASLLGEIDAATLRLLNGGEAAPLSGQRVCRR